MSSQTSQNTNNSRIKNIVNQKQQDKSSPLYSEGKTFEDLGIAENLLKGLYDMGYESPSLIQSTALPLLSLKPFYSFLSLYKIINICFFFNFLF